MPLLDRVRVDGEPVTRLPLTGDDVDAPGAEPSSDGDPFEEFAANVNMEMVDLDTPESEDLAEVLRMIEDHLRYTGSTVAKALLEDWENKKQEFVKVMPTDYKRVLEQQKVEKLQEAV